MTVAELIVQLQQMPQHLKVTYAQDNWDSDIGAVRVVTEYQLPTDGEKTTYVQLADG